MKNYYKVLSVTSDAPQEVIKAAYRQLALIYHPDKNKSPNAEGTFKEITEAYEILADNEKRKQYNITYSAYLNSQKNNTKESSNYQSNQATAQPKEKKDSINKLVALWLIIKGLVKKAGNTFLMVFMEISNVLGVQITSGIFLLGIFWIISEIPSCERGKQSQTASNVPVPKTGNLYQNESNPIEPSPSMESPVKKQEVIIDPYKDWESPNLVTGEAPDCYNFRPEYDKSIKNKLIIKVGSHTDVVLKLMNSNDVCIRYVYIRSGDTYTIKNIPEDIYYTKIAYGHNWKQLITEKKCTGKFTSKAMYKLGKERFNFFIVHKESSYEIPSYSLSLDVVSSNGNNFDTGNINEDEFND